MDVINKSSLGQPDVTDVTQFPLLNMIESTTSLHSQHSHESEFMDNPSFILIRSPRLVMSLNNSRTVLGFEFGIAWYANVESKQYTLRRLK